MRVDLPKGVSSLGARSLELLAMIWACMGSFSIMTFQWYFWGYSLAFSSTGTSGFIGNLAHFGLMNVLGEPSPGSPLIPELLYSFYQVSKGDEGDISS
jgi:Amt family ammonium transporter